MNGKNATILVVDDDDSIRSLLHQELSDAGYIIEEAQMESWRWKDSQKTA